MQVAATVWAHGSPIHLRSKSTRHRDWDHPLEHSDRQKEVIWRGLGTEDQEVRKQISRLGHEISNPPLAGFAHSGLFEFPIAFSGFISLFDGSLPVDVDGLKACLNQ